MKKFEQLKKLYFTMESEYAVHSDSNIFISAITADFDRLFELSWKTLKEYLSGERMIMEAKTGSPRQIIKLAYADRLLDNEDFWVKLLKDRNDDAHHYNESAARSYVSRIEREYLPEIKKLIMQLSEIIPEEAGCLCTVPDSFLEAVRESGMYYDEFLSQSMNKYGYKSVTEFFKDWERLLEKM